MQGGEDATKKQQNDFLRNQKILFDCTPHILADKMPFLAELICSFSIKKGLGFILPGWKAGGVSFLHHLERSRPSHFPLFFPSKFSWDSSAKGGWSPGAASTEGFNHFWTLWIPFWWCPSLFQAQNKPLGERCLHSEPSERFKNGRGEGEDG